MNHFRIGRVAAYTLAALLMSVPVTSARAQDIVPMATPVPQGKYKLDKTHASVTFRVMHLGASNYTARFTRMSGELFLDTKSPAASSVSVTIDPKSIETDFPFPEPDFNAVLRSEKWLDVARYPEITFKSTKIVLTAPNKAKVSGDFTLHGVTKPLTLDVTFNGGYGKNEFDPGGARAGFSARTTLKRSEFGISNGLPPPGTTMGVSDEVEVIIEAEFSSPGMDGPPPKH